MSKRLSKHALVLALMISIWSAYGQNANVGIGIVNPDKSAVLDITTPTGTMGLLIPRVPITNRANIQSPPSANPPAEGLLFYDAGEGKFWYRSLGNWHLVNPLSQIIGSGTATISGNITATGNISASGTITASNYSLNATGNGPIPKGGIIMWSGSVANIPVGWALCDGVNGPDLRERFIVGAGGDNGTVTPGLSHTGGYNPNDTGSNNANSVTLTVGQMPSHTHTMPLGGEHTHKYSAPLTSGDHPGGNGGYDRPNVVETGTTTNVGSGHSHTNNYSGGDQAHENRPPFYALAFIIKL